MMNCVTKGILHLAKTPQTGLTIQDLMKFGSSERFRLQCMKFVQNEIPIRIAKQIVLLDRLPYGLCIMPSILKVRDWYISSFEDFKTFSGEDPGEFASNIQRILSRHQNTLYTIGCGISELQEKREISLNDICDFDEIHQHLDEFVTRRIGIQVIIEHFMKCQQQSIVPNDKMIGIFETKCCPREIVKKAIEDTTQLCASSYSCVPKVEIDSVCDVKFPYMPDHLYYIVTELLKNSMRASLVKNTENPPSVHVAITDGGLQDDALSDVAIRVSDMGVGIPRSNLHKIWSYMYSTSRIETPETDNSAAQGILSGLGYGLPVARCYARYFGGSLEVMSLEGYGTDAYLHLNRLGKVKETLK